MALPAPRRSTQSRSTQTESTQTESVRRLGSIESDTRLVNHLLARGGVALRSELLELGVSVSSIDRRITSGLIRSFGGGAVGLIDDSKTDEHQRRAALIQRPDAVLAFETAAEVHGFPLGTIDHEQLHLLTNASNSARGHLGIIHRTKHLPEVDVTIVDGLRVTTVERTYLDLAICFAYGRMRWLGEHLLIEQRMTGPTLLACASSLARRGRAGTRFRRMLLGVILDEEPVHESIAERTFARLCRGYGITSLKPQFVPPWYDGLRGVVDFADPGRRKVVEVDGRRWHTTSQDRTNDRSRDRCARRHDWEVLRFGYDEIVQRPGFVAGELRSFLGLDRHDAA